MRFSLVPIDLYPSEVHSSTGELLFSLYSLTEVFGPRVDFVPRTSPIRGLCLFVGGVPDFTLELFRISIDTRSGLDYVNCPPPEVFGPRGFSFHAAPIGPWLPPLDMHPRTCLGGVTNKTRTCRGGVTNKNKGPRGTRTPDLSHPKRESYL